MKKFSEAQSDVNRIIESLVGDYVERFPFSSVTPRRLAIGITPMGVVADIVDHFGGLSIEDRMMSNQSGISVTMPSELTGKGALYGALKDLYESVPPWARFMKMTAHIESYIGKSGGYVRGEMASYELFGEKFSSPENVDRFIEKHNDEFTDSPSGLYAVMRFYDSDSSVFVVPADDEGSAASKAAIRMGAESGARLLRVGTTIMENAEPALNMRVSQPIRESEESVDLSGDDLSL